MGRGAFKFKMRSLKSAMREKFPLGRVSSVQDQERFYIYENHKDAGEKKEERQELAELTRVVLNYGEQEEQPDMWMLDHVDLSMTLQCLKRFRTANIYIPNPCIDIIAKNAPYRALNKHCPNQINLYGCTAEEQLQFMADCIETPYVRTVRPRFSFVWYDTCGYCQDEQYQTIELFSRLDIMRLNGPSVFAVTFSHRDNNTHMSKENKQKHKFSKRTLVDDWVFTCFEAEGYKILKPSRLRFPRVKALVYTWIYIVIPPTWEHTLDELNKLHEELNQTLEQFPIRTGNYPVVSVKSYESKPLRK